MATLTGGLIGQHWHMHGVRLRFPLILVWCSALLCAQQPPPKEFIEMCGIRLRIGLEQETVLKNLAIKCQSKSASDDATIWLIRDSGQTAGFVRFESGKLRLVMKDWSNNAKTPAEVGDAIFFAAKHLEAEGCVNSVLGTSQVDEPAFGTKRFEVVCGHKALRVTATHSKILGDSLEIEEVLFAPHQ